MGGMKTTPERQRVARRANRQSGESRKNIQSKLVFVKKHTKTYSRNIIYKKHKQFETMHAQNVSIYIHGHTIEKNYFIKKSYGNIKFYVHTHYETTPEFFYSHEFRS